MYFKVTHFINGFCLQNIKIGNILVVLTLLWGHMVSYKMFHIISGAPPQTLPNVKYDAPREVCANRKSFDRPLKK